MRGSRRGIGELTSIVIAVSIAIAMGIIVYKITLSYFQNGVSTKGVTVEPAGVNVYIDMDSASYEFYVGNSTSGFDYYASQVYTLPVIIYNAGTEDIDNISFKVVVLSSNYTVALSQNADTLDPISLTKMYTNLPTSLPRNSGVKVEFLIVTAKPLLHASKAPFIIEVTARYHDGSTYQAYVDPRG